MIQKKDYPNRSDENDNSIIVKNQSKESGANPKDLSMKSYIYLYNRSWSINPMVKKRPIIHYPQLDTVLMVENFIKKHSGEYKKRSLWEHLPKKMMYQTYQIIFDYLLESGKIARDKENKICWIWNPELVKKYLNDELLRIR
jgi:hypothetical protein